VEKALAERPAEAEEEDIRDTGARAEEEDDDERRLDEQEERLRWCAAETVIVALEKISRKGVKNQNHRGYPSRVADHWIWKIAQPGLGGSAPPPQPPRRSPDVSYTPPHSERAILQL
jgi:hypothetical protein